MPHDPDLERASAPTVARTAAPALALLVVAAALLLCVIARSVGYGLETPIFAGLALGLLGTAGWVAVAEERVLARPSA